MVEIDEKEYAKLKKDADDNRQLVKIVCMIGIVILLVIGYFGYGRKVISLSVERQKAEIQNEIAISKAKTNTTIREIEQNGITWDEYCKWLESRDELYSK